MSRFALVFAGIVLYMLIWAALLLPLALFVLPSLDPLVAVLVTFGLVILITVGLVPTMQLLAKRVYHFEGEGPPLSEAALRDRILQINSVDAPIFVQQRDDRLVITWNYVDAAWWNILSRSGLQQLYELHVKFDEANKTATLIDVHKSVDWRAGPNEVRIRGGYFRGVDVSYRRGVGYGIDDEFRFGKVYDYKFTTSEIKDPVLNTILKSGWDVKFGLY